MIKLLDYIKYIKENTYYVPDDVFFPISAGGGEFSSFLAIHDYDGSIIYKIPYGDRKTCFNVYESLKRELKDGITTWDYLIQKAKEWASKYNG